MKFSPYGSPIHLGFVEFHIEILMPPPPSGGAKQGWGGKISHFLVLRVNISKTVADTAKVTIDD